MRPRCCAANDGRLINADLARANLHYTFGDAFAFYRFSLSRWPQWLRFASR